MNAFPDRGVVGVMAQYWWTFVLRGVVAILFGITAWLWPDLTLSTLIWLAGFWLVFDGVLAIVGGIINRDHIDSLLPVILIGIAGIIAGLFIMAFPGFTVVWVIVTIGIYAIVSGLFGMISAVRLRKEISNEWTMALFGLISVIFGVMMIAFPGSGALSLIWVIAIYAIMIGITEIMFGFRIRNARSEG